MISTQERVQAEILGRAFPELLYDSDPDIERYFELRGSGKSAEALALYDTRLKGKYPDETRRVLLLSHYRTKDPRYPQLLRQSALELASSIIERIKRNIRYLTLPIEGLGEQDPYRLLKAVEQVVRFLPTDRFEAQASLDTYRRYAELLDFKREPMARAAELGKEYLFESVPETEDPNVDFMARSREIEERKRARRPQKHFDLSRIEFGPADIARIVLPSHLARKEDKVVGYCYKYWNLVGDQAFERVVLLYSRKYRTQHYDVFRAVKIGRARKFTDDEILNTVSTVLSSSYSYSVQGDIYMQSMWRRLKAAIAAPQPAGKPQTDVSAEPKVKPVAPKAAASKAKPVAPKAKATKATAPKAAAPKAKATKALAPKAKPAALEKGKARVENRKPMSAKVKVKAKPKAAPIRKRQIPVVKTGSVSDIIKEISGRTYDVYHDIFLERVRPSIRLVLSENQTRAHGLFDTGLNAAEEIVHAFMTANYDNPFMSWEGSEEQKRIEADGYVLPSLLPIISDCYRKL
jgi:hypothetical protein